jgi:hypothetical protein
MDLATTLSSVRLAVGTRPGEAKSNDLGVRSKSKKVQTRLTEKAQRPAAVLQTGQHLRSQNRIASAGSLERMVRRRGPHKIQAFEQDRLWSESVKRSYHHRQLTWRSQTSSKLTHANRNQTRKHLRVPPKSQQRSEVA